MRYENFDYELRDGAAFVTLITPDAETLGDLCEEWIDLLLRLQEEPQARVIVLGDGLRPFDLSPGLEAIAELRCAGRDFAELAPQEENARRVVTAIQEYGKPVIAAAAGCVREAGFGLFLAADIRLAADTATFQAPDIARGLLPGWGLLHTLPRLVGQSRALELLWSGRTIGAAEAGRIGLVERVVPAAQWEEELAACAARLAALPQPSTRLLKLAVQQSALFDFTAMLDLEYEAQQQCWAGPETGEAMAAFLDGRAPDFTPPPPDEADTD